MYIAYPPDLEQLRARLRKYFGSLLTPQERASGEIDFGIGYTEPEAGTVLAALQTKAVRDGSNGVGGDVGLRRPADRPAGGAADARPGRCQA
jgi:hypothetical protein